MAKRRPLLPTFIPERSDLFTKTIAKVTLNAWRPFDDCVRVNFELQNSDIGEDYPEWREHWVFGVVMLRTIGHVLSKVDSLTSRKHKDAIDRRWGNWKLDRVNNWVFWDFIEDERNNILKAYKFGVDVDEHGLWHSGLGRDGIQLMREAAYWWRQQLIDIEAELSV